MRVTSLDKSMSLSVAAPGCGFTLTLDSHLWLFDHDGRIAGSIVAPEPNGHIAVRAIERCPICVAFMKR